MPPTTSRHRGAEGGLRSLAKKRAASPPAHDAPSGKRRSAAAPLSWPEKLPHFSGTINVYKSFRLGPPGSGIATTAVEFKSGMIVSSDELEVVAEKIQTVGFVGSKGGPGSRRDFGHPLRTSFEQSSIDFSTHALALAIFPDRCAIPTIVDVKPAGGTTLQISCGSGSRRLGAMPARHGLKPVGFAAVVVPRLPGGKAWETNFEFHPLGEFFSLSDWPGRTTWRTKFDVATDDECGESDGEESDEEE